jgi:two-component system invasion response regulator UvrY
MRDIRILLVDDSLPFLEQMVTCLGDMPRAKVVGQAHSGREGVDLAAQQQPDLVIMDLAMPGMNGIEATRRVKAQPGAPLVWLVTLQDDSESRRAALLAGADEFVSKRHLLSRLIEMLAPEPKGLHR